MFVSFANRHYRSLITMGELRMNSWRSLDQFEELLRQDPDFAAKLDASELCYVRARQAVVTRLTRRPDRRSPITANQNDYQPSAESHVSDRD